MNIQAEWLTRLLSTGHADRARAEKALVKLYAAAGLEPLRFFFWFDSPFTALWATELLTAPHDWFRQKIIEASLRVKREKALIERLRAELCRQAEMPDWMALAKAVGEPFLPGGVTPMGGGPGGARPPKMVQDAVMLARLELYDDVMESLPHFDESDELCRVERSLRAVQSGQAEWSTINPMMSSAFSVHYSFSTMAMDQAAAAKRAPSPVLAAAWEVSGNAGLWWPFLRAAVLSDFPESLSLDAESRPHGEDGPAATYRDGNRLWAWHGHAMREEWIMKPAEMPARLLKEFDASFRAYAEARGASMKPPAKVKPSPLLKTEIPPEPAEREALLRRHNGGGLPLFDRYMAGEHEQVWRALAALGPSVRQDPHAADALAVAYETMRRVEQNVRHVTARLASLGYRFEAKEPHEPPGAKTRKYVAQLEKKAGLLPLSLRAFWEVVGAVDWQGEHASLAPRKGSVAPDPLVVYPPDGLLAQVESGFAEDEGALLISPDDLHKAHTSGGEPYEIEVPDPAADGKLLNENHDLPFVAYLRVVFRFGGFPGYDGIENVPREIEFLRAGLAPF